MKEMRRQEREKRQEEKRREEEEKKKQKEREKAEKAKLKEEARLAKEKEKREKAAAKAATAAAAASNETGDIQPTNVQAATRKKKKINNDETIEDEIVSDEELPHKKPKKAVAHTSSLSPTHLYQPDNSTDNYNTVMISQNGSGSNPVNTSATTELPSSVSEQPMVADLELQSHNSKKYPRLK